MSRPRFSTRNKGVRRIYADIKEMQDDPSDQYHAMPLDDNLFDWHFTLRGPEGTDFEGGVYHGRIVLPSEYPFKPPNIYFMNRNGRFEINKKICLSFSAYHPEEWRPAWGIRTILEAIISFMPSKSEGAIGSLNWTKEERQKCAKASHSFSCPTCGNIKALLPPLKDKKRAEGDCEETGEKVSKYASQATELCFVSEKEDSAKMRKRRGGSSTEGEGEDKKQEVEDENKEGQKKRAARPGRNGRSKGTRTGPEGAKKPCEIGLTLIATILIILIFGLIGRKMFRSARFRTH